jgi:hypothetical protein
LVGHVDVEKRQARLFVAVCRQRLFAIGGLICSVRVNRRSMLTSN